MIVKQVHVSDSRAQQLLSQLDRYLYDIYPSEANHIDDLAELEKSNVIFALALEREKALGCGAVKWMQHDVAYGEIKRLYVSEETRRKGCGEAIMQFLEAQALEKQVSVLRLEAGVHQPEALALYQKFGFCERSYFGDYPDDPLSVFMEKVILSRSQID